jgi:hypothetical protein
VRNLNWKEPEKAQKTVPPTDRHGMRLHTGKTWKNAREKRKRKMKKEAIRDKKVAFDDLSDDQKKAYEFIFDTVEVKQASKFFFITGEAGTGKSHLTRYIYDNHNTAITASTGIAAHNIGGCTMHRFFGIAMGKNHPRKMQLSENLRNIDVLIIDEISMVGYQLFGPCMHALVDMGIRVIMIGDFFQLPPVNDRYCFTHPFWNHNVMFALLTQNHRQSGGDNPDFVRSLNYLRWGGIDNNLARIINERQVRALPDDCVNIVPHRRTAEYINDSRLKDLGKEIFEYRVSIIWSKPKGSGVAERMVSSTTIPDVFNVCEGARIVMLTNDSEGKWVNGTTGEVTEVDDKHKRIYVTDDDGNEFCVRKQEHEIKGAKGESLVRFSQFPMALSFAMTIHKAQGMTLDKVGVDLSNHFDFGMTYVALSRCRTEEGLNLIGFINPNKTMASPDVCTLYNYYSTFLQRFELSQQNILGG